MDINDPVISKLFDRFYGQKFAEEKQQMAQAMEMEVTLANQRAVKAEAKAAQREAEFREAEMKTTQQWQELMLKVVEHRFSTIPVPLIMLLQQVSPDQRSRVSDLILDAPDATQCLQSVRQLVTPQANP